MSNWREYFKRKRNASMTPSATVNTSLTGTLTSTVATTGTITTTVPSYSPAWITGTTTIAPTYGPSYTMGTGVASMGATFVPAPPPNHLISLTNAGKEIVRLNVDGSVTWNQEIQIDEAAKAFARSISVGAEMAAGISKSAKLRMRDSVFTDLISIAKEKGSLTAEDLTYLLEASKIVEKLKGDKE